MKRIPLLLAVVAMLVVVLAPPAQAQASHDPPRINERVPVSGTFHNPCAGLPPGEEFTFEGTLHFLGNFVEDSSGVLHFTGHNNFQATGVSPSGAKYVITSLRNEAATFDFVEGESASTVMLRTTVIRQGEDGTEEDSHAHIVVRSTLNANGELTTEVLTFKVECQ